MCWRLLYYNRSCLWRKKCEVCSTMYPSPPPPSTLALWNMASFARGMRCLSRSSGSVQSLVSGRTLGGCGTRRIGAGGRGGMPVSAAGRKSMPFAMHGVKAMQALNFGSSSTEVSTCPLLGNITTIMAPQGAQLRIACLICLAVSSRARAGIAHQTLSIVAPSAAVMSSVSRGWS
jgi:hypothetical protein